MNRRNALKNLGLATGGILLFPSCDFSNEKVSIILNKLQINANQEALLTSIVDTILPEGKIPGGISAKAHNFVWAYIDDCASQKDQQGFIDGLNEFDSKSKLTLGDSFKNSGENKRLQTINDFLKSDEILAKTFVNNVKDLSVWCYMNSEYIMTNEMPYKLIPGAGSYIPCKTIDKSKRININA